MQHGTPSPHSDGEASPDDDHSDQEREPDQEPNENPARPPDRYRAPSPTPESGCGTFIHELLEGARDSSEGSTALLESLGRDADQLSDHLRRHPAAEGVLALRQFRAKVMLELSRLSELARKAVSLSDNTSELIDRVSRFLEEMDVVPLAEPTGNTSIVLQLDSVVVKRRFDRSGNLLGHWDVFFNGVKVRVSKGVGELVEVLAADDGSSSDQYVAFKTKEALGESLGIRGTAIASRVYQLRKVLQDEPRLRPSFVQTSEEGEYRIAVRRG